MLTNYKIVGEKNEVLETFHYKEDCDNYIGTNILPLTKIEQAYWRVEKYFIDEIIKISRYKEKEGHFYIDTWYRSQNIMVIINNAELAQWLFIAQDYTSFKDIPKEHRKQCRDANKIAKKLIMQVYNNHKATGIFQPYVNF